MERPTLLLVLPWSAEHPAGVSVVVRNLSVCMVRGALNPVIVVSDWAYSVPQEGEDGAPWFRFALFGGDVEKAGWKQFLAAPLRLFRTWRFLSSMNAKAVNFHYPSLQTLGVAVLKRIGLFRGRLVLSFHGTDVRKPRPGRESLLWTLIFGQTDAISACSRHLADRVADEFGLPPDRISVVHNGVDAAIFSPAATSAPLPKVLPAKYVISVGSYLPRKGHRVLLAAFAGIAGEFPDIGLVIAGMDGPEREPLQEEAARLGVGERLVCLVDLPREAVAYALSRARVCVQPSYVEPFGLAVIEAGACGAPLVASAVGGHLEILREDDTGLFFTAGDAAACTNALRRILQDRPAALAMADRFRKEVGHIYTWQACADAYLSLATD